MKTCDACKIQVVTGQEYPAIDKLEGGKITKTVLITGVNRGIGQQTTQDLAGHPDLFRIAQCLGQRGTVREIIALGS